MRPNKVIDTKLSSPLFHLPPKTVRGPEDVLSLAQRNLLRHLTWSLPSGQAIAKAVGLPALSSDQLAELGRIDAALARSTPLWYYVLKEAELTCRRARASGPLGGLIVGGVIVGLLRADTDVLPQRGARAGSRRWASRPGTFAMTDLLDYAGVGGMR